MEVKVASDRVMEDGSVKKVYENYIIEAFTFTEAEERATAELAHFSAGEFDVVNIKPASFTEVIFADEERADTIWYKTKMAFLLLDEKTGKEKRSNTTYLVQATSLRGALDNIDRCMQGSIEDYVQANVGETTILDVLEYTKSESHDE